MAEKRLCEIDVEKLRGGNPAGEAGKGSLTGYRYGVLDFPVTEGFVTNVMYRTQLNYKNAYGCAKVLTLMKFFSYRHEFNNKDLVKACGIGHNSVTRYVRAMEQAGILVIDRQEWVTSGFSASYRYTVKDGCDSGKGGLVMFSYDLEGTPFGEALDLYRDCKGRETLSPSGDADWCKCAPDWCYVSPYYMLSYRFMSDGGSDRLYECDAMGRLVSRFSQAPVYKSGRLYHPFHNTPKVLRYNLEFEGSPLVELFDLHASFFTLLCSLLRDRMPEDEFNDLFDTCFEGRLYSECASYCGTVKDAAKEMLQGWRNVWNIGVLHTRYSKVSDFMENRFPAFTNLVYKWERIVNEKGKKVKTIQQDLGEYETLVFARFARFLTDKYNVTPFLLHDAVYVSEKDMEKLPDDIKDIMNDWFLQTLKYQ